MNSCKTRGTLKIDGQGRRPFRKFPFQCQKSPDISSWAYRIAAEKRIGPFDFIFLAEGLYDLTAEDFGPYSFENAISYTDMGPKAAQYINPVHNFSIVKHKTSVNP